MRDTFSVRRILPALALLLLAQPAAASFAVCNKTPIPARVALGRFDGTGWTSQGWWTIAPHKCRTLLTGALMSRYYYLYASDGGPGSWAGSRSFCVRSNERFEIAGRAACARRGYDRKGFFQVDTGQKPDYTQWLSD
jgi:uncharacterized membrane protein